MRRSHLASISPTVYPVGEREVFVDGLYVCGACVSVSLQGEIERAKKRDV